MKFFETILQEVLDRRRAIENYDFEYRQNNINSCAFQHFRPIMKTLYIAQKLKNFNSKTLLEIKSCQGKPWWKKSSR